MGVDIFSALQMHGHTIHNAEPLILSRIATNAYKQKNMHYLQEYNWKLVQKRLPLSTTERQN